MHVSLVSRPPHANLQPLFLPLFNKGRSLRDSGRTGVIKTGSIRFQAGAIGVRLTSIEAPWIIRIFIQVFCLGGLLATVQPKRVNNDSPEQ